MKQYLIFLSFFVLIITFSGCENEPTDSAQNTAELFWQAVIDKDMEIAKNLATWESVDYLKYLNRNRTHPERFELGEQVMNEKTANIKVTLYSRSQGNESIRIQGQTVLINTEHGWRVDVKKSLGSVIKQSVNNVFDQLNNMMQKGIKELDQSFSDSMEEISKGLEEGAKELQRELERALPDSSPKQNPQAQEI